MKMSPDIPEFCDFDCPHADFPPADTAGLCRTMSAVWCKQLGELANKNASCEWRRRGGTGGSGAGGRGKKAAAPKVKRRAKR